MKEILVKTALIWVCVITSSGAQAQQKYTEGTKEKWLATGWWNVVSFGGFGGEKDGFRIDALSFRYKNFNFGLASAFSKKADRLTKFSDGVRERIIYVAPIGINYPLIVQRKLTIGFNSSLYFFPLEEYIEDFGEDEELPRMLESGLRLDTSFLSIFAGYRFQFGNWKRSLGNDSFFSELEEFDGFEKFFLEASIGLMGLINDRTSATGRIRLPDPRIRLYTEIRGNDYSLIADEQKTLNIRIENSGKGPAEGLNVTLDFDVPVNNLLTFTNFHYVGDLAPKSKKTIAVPLSARSDIETELNLKLSILCEEKDDFNAKRTIGLRLLPKSKRKPTVAFAPSEIAESLPRTSFRDKRGVAVVIGNRNYEFFPDKPVEYAHNDQKLMTRYASQVFGFRRILGGRDVGFAQLRSLFGTSKHGEGELFTTLRESEPVFIYLTGHGHSQYTENEKARSYVVPADGNIADLEATCYPLDVLYENLSYLIEYKRPERLMLIMDMCFSGYLTTTVSSARWESENPLQDLIDDGRRVGTKVICIFATEEAQTAKWYNPKQHGLLTYFVLKAFHNSKNENEQKADYNGDKKLTSNELRQFVLDENYGLPYYANQIEIIGNADKGQNPQIITQDRVVLLTYK